MVMVWLGLGTDRSWFGVKLLHRNVWERLWSISCQLKLKANYLFKVEEWSQL